MKPKYFAEVGDRFGRLTVVDLTSIRRGGANRRAAICDCSCGNRVTVLIQGLTRSNATQSCGCLKRVGSMSERFAETRQPPDVLTYRTHGLAGHPSYFRWANMVDRCTNPANPAYANYGGRGITVHAAWVTDPTAFLAYLDAVLGPCPDSHSLDRIDNNAGYEPGNLRWATRSEQVRNQRRRVS